MEKKKGIAKWGFGMAPMSSRMRERYDNAVQNVLDFLYENIASDKVDPQNISELKGMFNRCVREDQWDWFSVHTELGYPSKRDMRSIANELKELRRNIISESTKGVQSNLDNLIKSGILNCLISYQDGIPETDGSPEAGWVYILSTRENPNTLKIGMTTISVSKRVKEINSATGVLYPLSARAVYRVKNAAEAESAIFKKLEGYRIRKDREFFEIPFTEAKKTIKEYINQERMAYKTTGEVVWYDNKKQYGFIADGSGEDIFLHRSQLDSS